MKVLILQNYFTPYRNALFVSLMEQGVEVVVSYCQNPSSEDRRWRAPSNSVLRVEERLGIRLFSFVLAAPPRVLLSEHWDIVVFNDNNPTNLSTLFWMLTLKAFNRTVKLGLWVEHTIEARKPKLKTFYQKTFSRVLSAISDFVIALSNDTEQYLASIGVTAEVHRLCQSAPPPTIDRARIVRNPVLARFGYLGSRQPRKNIDTLLSAFSSTDRVEATLTVAGVYGENLDNRIKFVGPLMGIERDKFLASIDVLVLPSLIEPWGLVVNEALEIGTLAAVSSACGSRELVGSIGDRFVFEPTIDGIKSMIEFCMTLGREDVAEYRNRAGLQIVKYSLASCAVALYKILYTVDEFHLGRKRH